MEFHKSAEELQTLRKKLTQAEMPCRSGPKDSVADGSVKQAEQLEEQLDELQHLLSEERILRKGNISVGLWDSERQLAEIVVAKGAHWNVFGKSVQGRLVIVPEEALYMLDHGMLELYHNKLPVSLQQGYEMMLSESFPLHHYVVYSYLRNLGFIVFRYERPTTHSVIEETKSGKSDEVKETVEENMEKWIGGKQDKEVKETSPVFHYWKNENCQPLVHPSDATSLKNILNKLQVIKRHTRLTNCSEQTNMTWKFQITYNVFQPQKNFKKSEPGLPNHSICVCKFSEPPPSIGEMNDMAAQCYPVSLKYAVVDGRDISFYSILDIELPTYVEK